MSWPNALPLGRRVPGTGGGAHAGWRRHQGRALSFAIARSDFIHTPGLKVVYRPTRRTPRPAGLGHSRDDPVIFMEPKRHYRTARGEVPEENTWSPSARRQCCTKLGPSRARDILAWGDVHTALEASTKVSARATTSSWSICARFCPSTSRPFWLVKKTGACDRGARGAAHLRLRRRAGASIQERALLHLEAPILRVRVRHAFSLRAGNGISSQPRAHPGCHRACHTG